jgi:cob(I)alamin adenosyltransferase
VLVHQISMTKQKSISQSLEDLQQSLLQLELDLKSAHEDDKRKDVKDLERAIRTTKLVIQALKSKK